MKNTKRRILFVVCPVVLLVCAVGVTFLFWNPFSASLPASVKPIIFGKTTDDVDMKEYTIIGNVKALGEQIQKTKETVCYDFEAIPIDTLIEKLKLSEKSSSELATLYVGETYSMDLYNNGNFSIHHLTAKDGMDPIELTDQECKDIAEAFLKDLDLLCDDLEASNDLGDTKLVWEDLSETIIGKTVLYQPKTDSEFGVLGNSRVTVNINKDGVVTDVSYNHLHYKKTVDAALVSVESAYKTIEDSQKNSDWNLMLDNISSMNDGKLNFEKVQIGYYENVMWTDVPPTRQPVYIFSGTSGDDKKPFAITVPAVDYSKAEK